MTYIYDVILNYTDDPRIIEFFEWNKTDKEEHIKKIPIIKVSTKQLYEIINYNINITNYYTRNEHYIILFNFIMFV